MELCRDIDSFASIIVVNWASSTQDVAMQEASTQAGPESPRAKRVSNADSPRSCSSTTPFTTPAGLVYPW